MSTRRGSTTRWRRIRAEVLERDGETCQLRIKGICVERSEPMHVHHTKGHAATGDNPRYLVAACSSCNEHLGDPEKYLPTSTMSPTTFHALREHLRLPVAYTAEALGITTRTLSRWEAGNTRLPQYASDWLQGWVELTEAQIDWATRVAEASGELCLHASPAQYRAAHTTGLLNHTWWNSSMARVAASTGAELAYEACQKPDQPREALAPACTGEVE